MGATNLVVEEAAGSEAAALAAEAAAMLGGRLRFLRAAWSGDNGPMNVPEIEGFAAGLGLGRRVQIEFATLDRQSVFTPAEARLLLNMLLLAVEGLAGSGRLAITGANGADVTVGIAGPRAAWPAGLATWLADESAAWEALTSARSLQAPLTALIAHRAGLRLSMLLPVGIAPEEPPPLLLSLSRGH